MIASYPPEICGIGTFTRDSITALQNFTGEIDSINVAAIDRSNGKNIYHAPVDLVIDQFNPESWYRVGAAILERAYEKGDSPTAIILQHEFGLSGRNAKGNDYQNIAKFFKEGGLRTAILANLHTILSHPNEHQKKVIRELAEYTDGIIVPTERAIDILSSKTYQIDNSKIKHIDHGIRTHDLSSIDCEEAKKELNLEEKLVVSTLGLKSLDKGIDYGVEGYGNMINKCFSKNSKEKKKLIYLVVGEYHPNFIKDYFDKYEESQKRVSEALKKTKLKAATIKNLRELKKEIVEENDVVFLDSYVDESLLRDFYSATDILLLTYRNPEQMCSGILADSIGFGKSVITTKFPHAMELLFSGEKSHKGIMGKSPNSRGIAVDLQGKDKNQPSVEQIADGIEYLIFNPKIHSKIGMNARRRGYDMRWENVTRDLVQYIGSILEAKLTPRGKSIILKKDKK